MTILSLVSFTANMQTCEASGSQANSTVEINFFQNSNGSTPFVPLDIVVDSNNSRYLFYELNGTGDDIRATKIYENGTYSWTMKYTGMFAKQYSKSVAINNDGTKIRMLSQASGGIVQLSEITTGNFT